MAIKRKFPPRVATVYCSGGCRAKKDEDGGKIVQRGTHDELIQEDGIYADFVGGKKETAGWKLKKRKKSGAKMERMFLQSCAFAVLTIIMRSITIKPIKSRLSRHFYGSVVRYS